MGIACLFLAEVKTDEGSIDVEGQLDVASSVLSTELRMLALAC